MADVTRDQARTISKEIEQAIQPILQNYGLSAMVEKTIYGTEYGCKIKGMKTNGKSVRQAEFEKHCYLYGLKPEDFGKTVEISGKSFQIAGLKLSAKKYPILLSREGKMYHCQRSSLRL